LLLRLLLISWFVAMSELLSEPQIKAVIVQGK
jgi:hypothetical protein